MHALRRYLPFLSILALMAIQGCSIKTSEQLAENDAIDELAHKSGLQIDPSVLKHNKQFDTNDSWQYLISLFAIPAVDDALIEKQMQWYLARPKYIATIQSRAEPYLYNIIKQVEAKELPGEIALLPAVESGFKPHAYSHSHASGLWQFIPSTGKLYGLDQNWWYDGRRDVYASTDAATSYLKKLGAVFDNDWLLALASYNAGVGTVSRAVKRNAAKNQATDYWSLDLPQETKNYVPKLLALAKIFANAEQYGISLKSQTHRPAFAAVNIGSQIDMATAAKLSAVSQEALLHFNPGFKQGYTPPQGPHRLLIPIDNVELFKTNLALLPADQRVQWHRHQIKAGDNLGSIARYYRTDIRAIREVNNLKNNTIHAGKYLLIPSPQNLTSNIQLTQVRSISPVNKNTRYTIKHGDNLWRIAQKFNLDSKEIARFNHIALNSPLHEGQTLIIKGSKQQSGIETTKTQPLHYTVRRGDSLYAISEKFNVSVADLRKWNASKLGEFLQPGQTLTVKANRSEPAT